MTEYMYRFFDCTPDEPSVMLQKYWIVRSTPCGVWIRMPQAQKDKFVLSVNAHAHLLPRRFAYASKDHALRSYIRRKQLQILYSEETAAAARRRLSIAKTITIEDGGIYWISPAVDLL